MTQPRIPPDVLELLVTDPDPLVADRAERMAAFRGVDCHMVGAATGVGGSHTGTAGSR